MIVMSRLARALRSSLRLPAGAARRSRSTRSTGQSLVEFALILPAFLFLLLGLFDLGRAVYAQNALAQAAREATRVGVVSPDTTAAKYLAIRNAAIAGAPAVSLTGANVTGDGCADCFYPDGAVPGGRIVVNLSVRINMITPLISNIVGNGFTVTANSVRYLP